MDTQSLPLAVALSIALLISGGSYAQDDEDGSSRQLVEQGFDISPVPKADLNFREETRNRVGLGSYLVNAVGDCSGCHSFPQYLEKGNTAGSNPAAGDPFEGMPSTQSAKNKLLVANFNISQRAAPAILDPCPYRKCHLRSRAAEDGDTLSRNDRLIEADRVHPRGAIQVAVATRNRGSCPPLSLPQTSFGDEEDEVWPR